MKSNKVDQASLDRVKNMTESLTKDCAIPETVAIKTTLSEKTMFISPAAQPTMSAVKKIRYDFNQGCRVELPTAIDGEKWKIRFTDTVTANILFEIETDGGTFQSTKRYFVPIKIDCWLGGELVFTHELALKNQLVQIQIPVGTLGDAIAWFPYVNLFQKKHQCQLVCVISDAVRPLFEKSYPNIKFVSQEESVPMQKDFYASYALGLFFNDWNGIHQPVDFRYVGLHKTAAHILGVEPIEEAPILDIKSVVRTIKEPYVCIAVQSSTQSKYWNNPTGWLEIVKWLKDSGYRVLCIDKEAAWGQGLSWTCIPNGAEDMTGPKPLLERAALLKHADFFVGLSSGLAWLAWAAGAPTVMISGFTHPNNEFYTPYRVFNHHTCNSCWNDPRQMFDHFDFMWCPRLKGTDRQFECTRLITVDHVKSVIRSIPGFLGERRLDA
jgi:autotransporter strand-loop-strand O-heptosyltransferase